MEFSVEIFDSNWIWLLFKIHDIVFDRTEEAWSANIKRGVLNMLQVNLKEQSSTDNTEMKLLNTIETDGKSPRFYRVMEVKR